MRIRKRQVPLPLSSLSPVPLSDLRLLDPSPPPVQLRPSNPLLPPQPLDHPNQRLSLTRRHFTPSATPDASKPQPDLNLESELEKEEEEDEDRRKKKEEEDGGERLKKSNDSRNPSIFFAAHTSSPILPQSIPPHNQVERWCDGDKAFPLKKRRGSFERRGSEEERGGGGTIDKDAAAKMKTKMNNKCDLDHQHHHDNAPHAEAGVVAKNKQRGGRGGAVLMEGSRCSRVNGRGWRCCQQTLVGYSLCEHHLGKGRLRSMNSVRSRSLAAASDHNNNNPNHATNKKKSIDRNYKLEKQIDDSLNQEAVDEDEKKPLTMTATSKKRVKLGMVKARSMSSLLGQARPINNHDDDHDCDRDHMQI